MAQSFTYLLQYYIMGNKLILYTFHKATTLKRLNVHWGRVYTVSKSKARQYFHSLNCRKREGRCEGDLATNAT